MPGMNARDTALANMYQRLPGSALSTVRKLKPMNYAALEVPEFAPLGDALTVQGSTRGDVHSRWKTYTLPLDATLSDALAAVERTNAVTKRARKFKLTFCNGVHMDLVRSDPEDPSTLTYGSLFDPSGAFRAETAALVDSRRPANEAALQATAGADGHLFHRDRTVSSLHPSVLYRNAPQPTAGSVGFAFTPMSPTLFQPRPNKIIAGVRPSIRNVNPDAYYYRPRPVPLERAEASLQQTRDIGAHPHATVYPSEPVDHRFRLVTALPAQASLTASRGPRHAAKFMGSMKGSTSPAAAASHSVHYEPPAAADTSLPPIHQ